DTEPPTAWLPVLKHLQTSIAHADALRERLVTECEAPAGLKRIRASSGVLEYRCKARGCLLLTVAHSNRVDVLPAGLHTRPRLQRRALQRRWPRGKHRRR